MAKRSAWNQLEDLEVLQTLGLLVEGSIPQLSIRHISTFLERPRNARLHGHYDVHILWETHTLGIMGNRPRERCPITPLRG